MTDIGNNKLASKLKQKNILIQKKTLLRSGRHYIYKEEYFMWNIFYNILNGTTFKNT